MRERLDRLVRRLVESFQRQAQVPPGLVHTFDPRQYGEIPAGQTTTVRKTSTRLVRSVRFGLVKAREVICQSAAAGSEPQVYRSATLAALAPKGGRYAFDLIAQVGILSFLECRSLSAIHSESLPDVPLSSLHDARSKFLFYLGKLHRQAAPRLREQIHDAGAATWLIDGTVEPGSPVFFAVKETTLGVLLECWKIPTENVPDVARCLTQAAAQFGAPARVLHDLSPNLDDACGLALPAVPHHVCHYHFLADLGKALYQSPHQALSRQLHTIDLKYERRTQRKKLTRNLQPQHPSDPAGLVLHDLLRGRSHGCAWTSALATEVLLAMHMWMLDFPADGQRQSFPFDPYPLLFHRRVVVAAQATERLVAAQAAQQLAFTPLTTFRRKLQGYLHHPDTVKAAHAYEEAFSLFDRIRQVLRLSPEPSNPMHAEYALQPADLTQSAQDLGQTIAELAQLYEAGLPPTGKELYGTALKLLRKYHQRLLIPTSAPAANVPVPCTTNGIESDWCASKRALRTVHGRRNLTRDLLALPPEYMLVRNLHNPHYVRLVLGDFDQLPAKLAEAAAHAGPWSHWRRSHNPTHPGRLPKPLLRTPDLIQQLVDVYSTACVASLS